MNPHLQKLVSKGYALKRQMWRHHEPDRSKRDDLLLSVMRIGVITWAGLKENRLIARAAGLSFSSLLGLGPIIALMVMVSGFVLDQAQPDMAQKTIENALKFVAPQVTVSPEDGGNSELGELINRFIESSKSGAVGIVGMITLILIVIQLFTSIEDAFNDIWGVQRGRSLITRIILYWTTISLGALLVFAGVAILISQAVALGNLVDVLPGSIISEWIGRYGAKIGGFAVFVAVLALFYRFIPNTQVEWKASIVGALFTVACFIGLNALAFLYVERVAMQRTLYGSLGILPVLMIGFYFAWMFLLLGGRVSFAVQNAHFKSGKVAWDEMSQAAQESLCLLLFTQVSRQFRRCDEPLSSVALASAHNLPRQLVSAAMHRLTDVGFVSTLPPKEDTPFDAYRYQPAKPLDKIRLVDFKRAFETEGHAPDEDLFDNYDPVVAHYHKTIDEAREHSFGNLDIDTLLAKMDASDDDSAPPQSKAKTDRSNS